MVQSSQKCSRELSRNICVRLLSMIATNRDKGLMCREITRDQRNAFASYVAFALLFSPRSLKKALAALAVEPTVYAAKRNGNHNNENLFDLFARECALCREHLYAGSCPAE